MHPLTLEEQCRIAYAKLGAAENLRLFVGAGWGFAASFLWHSWIISMLVCGIAMYLTTFWFKRAAERAEEAVYDARNPYLKP